MFRVEGEGFRVKGLTEGRPEVKEGCQWVFGFKVQGFKVQR